MFAVRNMCSLRANVGPGCLQAIARVTQSKTPRILTQHLNAPAKTRTEPQRTLMIEPPVIQIRRSHVRCDARQPFRLLRRRKQLCRSLVREAVHPDAAVAGSVRQQPRYRLRSIARLVTEWIKLSLRSTAPAHILNYNMISMPREPHRMRIHDSRSDIPPVRLTHQQRRPRPLAQRIVMIRDQRGTVTQHAFHAALQPDPVAAIDHQAPCLGSKLYIATSTSAMRAAAALIHRSPFSAVAAVGSPRTPLGAMSFVSQAKLAEDPSGFNNSG